MKKPMNNRINKNKFIEMVHDKVRGICSRENVYWTVKAVFECMDDILEEGDELYIREYFTLYPRFKKEMKASNFGNPCVIPAHYIPEFKPGSKLKRACEHFTKHEDDEEIEDEDTRD